MLLISIEILPCQYHCFISQEKHHQWKAFCFPLGSESPRPVAAQAPTGHHIPLVASVRTAAKVPGSEKTCPVQITLLMTNVTG